MDFFADLIHSVKASVGLGIGAGDVIAVIRKLFSGRKTRCLANNLVALNNQPRAVGVSDDPFSAEQGDGVFGSVLNRDKVNESVGFVGRQTRATVVVMEFVEPSGEARKFTGSTVHDANRCGNLC